MSYTSCFFGMSQHVSHLCGCKMTPDITQHITNDREQLSLNHSKQTVFLLSPHASILYPLLALSVFDHNIFY